MSYLIHASEPAAEAVRRIVREQNQRVLALLEDWVADPPDRIHRARQTCKRIRGLLRLVRPGARYVFQVENRFFRDIQRKVAYARDAEAMVEALDGLRAAVTEPLLAESVRMLREALAGRVDRAMEDSREVLAGQVRICCAELALADQRLALLPIDHLRRRELRKGAIRTLTRCATRYETAAAHGDAPAFHAWRKEVKYAYHQTRLLAEIMPVYAAERGPALRELAAVLGQSQDLELLDGLLRKQPDTLGIDTHVHRLRRLTATTQHQLRERGLLIGAALFVPPQPDGEAAPKDDACAAS